MPTAAALLPGAQGNVPSKESLRKWALLLADTTYLAGSSLQADRMGILAPSHRQSQVLEV